MTAADAGRFYAAPGSNDLNGGTVSEQTLKESVRSRVLSLGTLPVACTVVVGINALYILLVAIGNYIAG